VRTPRVPYLAAGQLRCKTLIRRREATVFQALGAAKLVRSHSSASRTVRSLGARGDGASLADLSASRLRVGAERGSWHKLRWAARS
jgi:hypothetical protein